MMNQLVLQRLQRDLQTFIEKHILNLSEDDASSVDVSFLAPDKEFVALLGANPTVNCYLIGVEEDKKRRQSEPLRSELKEIESEGGIEKVRALVYEPRFVDVTYMITVWSKDRESSAIVEHLLLGYLIVGLGGSDFFPGIEMENPELEHMLYGIRMTLFGSEYADKVSGQVWQAMGATPKPSLMLSLSVPMAVREETIRPVVKEIERSLNHT